jgi:hypothetical protein
LNEREYNLTLTVDIFGNEDGYFYSVTAEEKKKWRVNSIELNLGHGQAEKVSDALAECSKIVSLYLPPAGDPLDTPHGGDVG